MERSKTKRNIFGEKNVARKNLKAVLVLLSQKVFRRSPLLGQPQEFLTSRA